MIIVNRNKLGKHTTKQLLRMIKGIVIHEHEKDQWETVDAVVDELLRGDDLYLSYNDLFNYFLENKITNDYSLHCYIRIFLGFFVPRSTPFGFISDMFFEKNKNAVAFANRTGGKTLDIAILNHLDMTFGCTPHITC